MNQTINISLPKGLYLDAKKAVTEKNYSSISELFRDALRRILYPELTENGFTPEFEEEVLRRENDPNEKTYAWNGKGSFVDFVLKTGRKDATNRVSR